MKIETAQNLAATAHEGITATQVKDVIDAFLDAISRCPVCDRSGEFTFTRDTAVTLATPIPNFPNKIPSGATSTCPCCGDPSSLVDPTPGDPEFFGWHCFAGDSVAACHSRKGDDDPSHVLCGDRVLLSLPKRAPTRDAPMNP